MTHDVEIAEVKFDATIGGKYLLQAGKVFAFGANIVNHLCRSQVVAFGGGGLSDDGAYDNQCLIAEELLQEIDILGGV